MEQKEQSEVTIFCPHCQAPSKPNPPEYTQTKCNECNQCFSYVKCFHCKTNMFLSNPKIDLDGINIKCPKDNCQKFFCRAKCPNCQRTHHFSNGYQEGGLVKCSLEDCGVEFTKIHCPNERCNNKIIYLKEMNYREGQVVVCSSCGMHFQKVNCCHCFRRLVWVLPNQMIDGQKIRCPYEDCKKSFNKLYCPKCKKINLFPKGGMEMGGKVTCIYKNCGKSFQQITCPFCLQANVLANNSFEEGSRMECTSHGCKMKFVLVNCIYCKRTNFWKDTEYIKGQCITCAYPDCKKSFSRVKCPSCSRYNVFPKGDFSFGRNYQCAFQDCRKHYASFICPKCYLVSSIDKLYLEGSKIVCPNPICEKKLFFNFRCPHCLQTIIDEDCEHLFGQTILCPYATCNKKFNYIFCGSCKRGIYDKDNTYKEGSLIVCPYPNCRKVSAYIYCTKCNKGNCISGLTQPISTNQAFKCTFCSKYFVISKVELNVFCSGKALLSTAPSGYKYIDPDKDIHESMVMNSILPSDYIFVTCGAENNDNQCKTQKKVKSEQNPVSDCIMCMEHPREAVFIPCGHRCTCYKCGKEWFDKHKKCIMCNTESIYLLEKVFDS